MRLPERRVREAVAIALQVWGDADIAAGARSLAGRSGPERPLDHWSEPGQGAPSEGRTGMGRAGPRGCLDELTAG